MDTFKTITCIGKDGVTRSFLYEDPEEGMDYEREVRSWTYRVKECREDTEFFEFTIEESGEHTLRVVGMYNHGYAQYTSKGIPEAMIVRAKQEFAKIVHSSSSRNQRSGQFRTVPADKIWKRLVARSEAVYDESRDIYQTA